MADAGHPLPLDEREATDRDERSVRELQGALHDIANALTVVLGCAEIAAREAPDATSTQTVLRWARHARGIARRAIGAANGLDCDDGNDVQALLRDAIAGIEPHALHREVSLELDIEAGLGAEVLSAWPIALQVLTNLLLNAVAFTALGTAVRVEASRQSGHVRLLVTDCGPGVPEKSRDRLFDGVLSSRAGGTGIGLRNSQALARSHGASLRALDVAQGACFEMTWPMQPLAGLPDAGKRAAQSLAGRRILVLDDDDAVLTLLEAGLSARGADVRTTADAKTAGNALRSERFDAALVDLSPVAAELDVVLHAMRSANPEIRVILISGTSGPLPEMALNMASAWIRKPFEIGEVVEAVVGEDA